MQATMMTRNLKRKADQEILDQPDKCARLVRTTADDGKPAEIDAEARRKDDDDEEKEEEEEEEEEKEEEEEEDKDTRVRELPARVYARLTASVVAIETTTLMATAVC
jgi:ribosomal protein L12E/L44/L45/RPP1/RPP2